MNYAQFTALKAACGTEAAALSDVEFINKYVKSVFFGTAGANFNISNDYDYTHKTPISYFYYCTKQISELVYEFEPADDWTLHQRYYVAMYMDLSSATNIFVYSMVKPTARVKYEENIKAQSAANDDLKRDVPWDYKKIAANKSYPPASK